MGSSHQGSKYWACGLVAMTVPLHFNSYELDMKGIDPRFENENRRVFNLRFHRKSGQAHYFLII